MVEAMMVVQAEAKAAAAAQAVAQVGVRVEVSRVEAVGKVASMEVAVLVAAMAAVMMVQVMAAAWVAEVTVVGEAGARGLGVWKVALGEEIGSRRCSCPGGSSGGRRGWPGRHRSTG